jgi:hypothetical protein
LFRKVKLDSVGIGVVCEGHQLAAVEKLILLAVRYVAVDFGHPALLDLDKIRVGWKSMVGVQCVLFLWAQEVIVVVVAIIDCCSTTTAAAAAAAAGGTAAVT